MVSRRMERCSRDGRDRCSCSRFRPWVLVPSPVREVGGPGEEEGTKEIVESGTEGPCCVRMGVGVPSCETCTPSYARCGDVPACLSSLVEEDDEGDELNCMSVLR
jgi:hypothetical protein